MDDLPDYALAEAAVPRRVWFVECLEQSTLLRRLARRAGEALARSRGGTAAPIGTSPGDHGCFLGPGVAGWAGWMSSRAGRSHE